MSIHVIRPLLEVVSSGGDIGDLVHLPSSLTKGGNYIEKQDCFQAARLPGCLDVRLSARPVLSSCQDPSCLLITDLPPNACPPPRDDRVWMASAL